LPRGVRRAAELPRCRCRAAALPRCRAAALPRVPSVAPRVRGAGSMGQITVFEKSDCHYCVRVLGVLDQACDEAVAQARAQGCALAQLSVKRVDVSREGAYAAFCIRTTGTFTVPHVFFNEEYVGKAENILAMDAESKGGSNVLRGKLRELAAKPSPDPAFPPAPDAALVKVTERLAFSAQPTLAQLGGLRAFGIASVLNILRPDSPAFNAREEVIVRGDGVAYLAQPIMVVTAAGVLKALEALQRLPAPVLVHDDAGHRAGMLVLLAAARQLARARGGAVPDATLMGWAKDLGLELKQYAAVISQVLGAPDAQPAQPDSLPLPAGQAGPAPQLAGSHAAEPLEPSDCCSGGG
jgi:protein tyrosine phosphatase (PTP) superfamily phosphohydrolase (DUF442 family)/glutaredoxin